MPYGGKLDPRERCPEQLRPSAISALAANPGRQAPGISRRRMSSLVIPDCRATLFFALNVESPETARRFRCQVSGLLNQASRHRNDSRSRKTCCCIQLVAAFIDPHYHPDA